MLGKLIPEEHISHVFAFSFHLFFFFFAPTHIWFGFSAGLPRPPSFPEKKKTNEELKGVAHGSWPVDDG